MSDETQEPKKYFCNDPTSGKMVEITKEQFDKMNKERVGRRFGKGSGMVLHSATMRNLDQDQDTVKVYQEK